MQVGVAGGILNDPNVIILCYKRQSTVIVIKKMGLFLYFKSSFEKLKYFFLFFYLLRLIFLCIQIVLIYWCLKYILKNNDKIH